MTAVTSIFHSKVPVIVEQLVSVNEKNFFYLVEGAHITLERSREGFVLVIRFVELEQAMIATRADCKKVYFN